MKEAVNWFIRISLGILFWGFSWTAYYIINALLGICNRAVWIDVGVGIACVVWAVSTVMELENG